MVVADAEHVHRQLTAALARLTGEQRTPLVPDRPPKAHAHRGRTAPARTVPARRRRRSSPGVVRLQLSWEPGRVVGVGRWAGLRARRPRRDRRPAEPRRSARRPLDDARGVKVPGSGSAESVSAPVGEVLGWLVAAGAGQVGADVGPSVRWLGQVAMWAVELAARGAMVPLLPATASPQRRVAHRERVVRGPVDTQRSSTPPASPRSSARCPAASPPSTRASTPRALTRSALTAMVDAIGRRQRASHRGAGPRRRPSAPGNDVTEAFLARLDRQRVRRADAGGRRTGDARRGVGPAR